ncbi:MULTISPECIES: chorismate pyruvate-lyase family protein [Candidatus Nitrosocaldus]|jgi:chorismate-pyruvate lyase|uniref:Putative 4-hydroxybenzoate synthetase (Chorismate lyase) n=1 Tax=Candidatus Nitrosocaldus cavascurensis TaxID=2058097 RepID=A0A2K5APU2_9ARCH|nr:MULTISPECIES: chorismate pyruvate-lyase family protein [Candidatus Nitrosocaldus]SPC33662.1 putative 4-hydroxybenzoate synthetase (Chorismate lyase) [Candidatus Nitrosocaldus cavascurensis]
MMIKQVSVEVGSGDFGTSMLSALKKLEDAACIKLSRIEKLLLAEVGTVEQLLSILVDAPVSVDVVRQEEVGKVIEREVNIRKAYSDEILLDAKSIINVDVLPDGVVCDIRAKRLGIGSVIMKHRLETFRRIVEIGCYYSNDESKYDKGEDEDEDKERVLRVYRLYSIFYVGTEAFRIREEFRSSVIRRLASFI